MHALGSRPKIRTQTASIDSRQHRAPRQTSLRSALLAAVLRLSWFIRLEMLVVHGKDHSSPKTSTQMSRASFSADTHARVFCTVCTVTRGRHAVTDSCSTLGLLKSKLHLYDLLWICCGLVQLVFLSGLLTNISTFWIGPAHDDSLDVSAAFLHYVIFYFMYLHSYLTCISSFIHRYFITFNKL